mmetsp:Transcript_28866/g.94356  ORF Transcript_28866/g.94356 Transcript_28866/m.94356 type:complete len:160 (-) Transcript_28866:39-518(-)
MACSLTLNGLCSLVIAACIFDIIFCVLELFVPFRLGNVSLISFFVALLVFRISYLLRERMPHRRLIIALYATIFSLVLITSVISVVLDHHPMLRLFRLVRAILLLLKMVLNGVLIATAIKVRRRAHNEEEGERYYHLIGSGDVAGVPAGVPAHVEMEAR